MANSAKSMPPPLAAARTDDEAALRAWEGDLASVVDEVRACVCDEGDL